MAKGIVNTIQDLKNNSIIILHFKDDCIHDSQLNDDTFEEFCKAFENNTSLATLDFSGCNFSANINFLPFFLALQNNKTLKSLIFSGITLGEGLIGNYMKELSEALSTPDGNTSLNSLDLSNCKINNKHIEDLTFLKNNHHLIHVNLEKNEIMPSGIAILARQLKHYPRHSTLYPVAANSETLKNMPIAINENAQNDKLLELKLDGNKINLQSKHYNAYDILNGINIALANNKPVDYKNAERSEANTETTNASSSDEENTNEELLDQTCDIIFLTNAPNSNFDANFLKSLTITSNAAYIRVKNNNINTLFYINNRDEDCYEVKLNSETLKLIDEKFKPNTKPRTLSELEINELQLIIHPNHSPELNSHKKADQHKQKNHQNKKRKEINKTQGITLPRLTFANHEPSFYQSTSYSIDKTIEANKTKHIRWYAGKFSQGGAAIGLFVVTGLMIAGLLAGGPIGWAILASIVVGSTLFGATVGSIVGAATAPAEERAGLTNNAVMTRELMNGGRAPIVIEEEDNRAAAVMPRNDEIESPNTPAHVHVRTFRI